MTEFSEVPDVGADDDLDSALETDDLADVEFEDGTNVTDPYQDALGQVYESRDDYTSGTDPHELDTSTPDDGTAEADPAT